MNRSVATIHPQKEGWLGRVDKGGCGSLMRKAPLSPFSLKEKVFHPQKKNWYGRVDKGGLVPYEEGLISAASLKKKLHQERFSMQHFLKRSPEKALHLKRIVGSEGLIREGVAPLSGQASVLLIAIMLFIIMGVVVFLMVNSLKPREASEYNNLYVHNLLLSVMRKTTGYGGTCHTFSDAAACCYFTPEKRCGEKTCKQVCDEDMNRAIMSTLKPTFDYFLSIEPENWESTGGDRIFYGNSSLENSYPVWVANEKVITPYDFNLRVKLVVGEK